MRKSLLIAVLVAACGGATPSLSPATTEAPAGTVGPCIDHAKVTQYVAVLSEHVARLDLADRSLAERQRVANEFGQMRAAAAVLQNAIEGTRPDIGADLNAAATAYSSAALDMLLDDVLGAGDAMSEGTARIGAISKLVPADYCPA